MPESNGPVRLTPLTLSQADEIGCYIRARCGLCSTTYHYRPIDFVQLLGDVPCNDLVGKMRCARCDRVDYVDLRVHSPAGEELKTMRVRRVAGVRMLRKVLWRDEQA